MPSLPNRTATQPPVRRSLVRRLRPRVVAGLAGLATLTVTLALTQQSQQPLNTGQPRADATLMPGANRTPDANDQMAMNDQQAKKNKFEAANLERRKQISDDAARLLQLATDLKTEVDKTGKDTLSLNVIRKAEAIEKLAKGVQQKMKLTVGAS